MSIGDDQDALDLMQRLWGQMITRGPDYTGALWEKMAPGGTAVVDDGSDPIDNNSLAHGWASGPTWQMSQYVLGAAPVDPGYRTWTVQPHTGNLRWAQGQVPTAYGPLKISWQQSANRRHFSIEVTVPRGTSGTVVLPLASSSVRVDGAARKISATAGGAQLQLGGGTHTVQVDQ